MGKIFGIGLMKTGTTSLCHALEILGYSAIQSPEPLERINQYDAAADRNITENFEYLDRLYPGSKFIYTIRDTSSWIQSFLHHKCQKKLCLGRVLIQQNIISFDHMTILMKKCWKKVMLNTTSACGTISMIVLMFC